MNNLKIKLVIVDDEPMILKSLKRELEPWVEEKNLEIETFPSAKEALLFLSHNHKSVFLVISDLRMPEIKGSKFLEQVNKLYPEIKLFLLTAHSDIDDIQDAIKASIARLLLKPWDHNGLRTDIENALEIYLLQKKNRELKDEVDQNLLTASQFQKAILSSTDIINGNIEVNIEYNPIETIKCGGDFYHVYNIDENKKILMIGDVAGHGIKPAFVTSMLKVLCSMLKPEFYKKNISTAEIVEFINKGLLNSLGNIRDILVTFSVVYIDLEKKIIDISGAGNLPLYILRKDNLIAIKDENIVLGFIHDSEYKNIIEPIEQNDLIIMFTDGLIESEKSRTIINSKRIEGILLTLDLKDNPAEKIYKHFKLLQENDTFVDDVTVVTAKIL
ncbi:MAG: fused response regulator/phosphatase [Spirochaetales bacterium]|nr:fused response regulator/phosphatase [Spirochaetales bacterium]